MTSAYQKKFAMPEGFPVILKDFAREVLRAGVDSEEQIYAFGAQYFTNVASGQGQGGAQIGNRLNMDEMRVQLKQLFEEADLDGNGCLDQSEFKKVFRSLQGDLGLTDRDVRIIMAEADEDGDGTIQYAEFAQVCGLGFGVSSGDCSSLRILI